MYMPTKTIVSFLILTSTGIMVSSCKSKSGLHETPASSTTTATAVPLDAAPIKESQPNKAESPENQAPKPHRAAEAQTDTLVRYWVSFYSIGTGVDYASANSFFNWLDEEKGKGSIDFEKFRWGREGEVDACITLLQKTMDDKEAWISMAQARLAKAEHVHQKRNGICKTRR